MKPMEKTSVPSSEPKKTSKITWRQAWSAMSGLQKTITIIVAVIFLFVFYVMLDANKYRALVRVIEGEGKVGVNPTAQALDFGDLARGTSQVRRVNLANGTFMPMYIIVVKTGKIGELMDVSRNNFKLAPGSTIKIDFNVYMPASAQIDARYTGRVYLFKIPTFWL